MRIIATLLFSFFICNNYTSAQWEFRNIITHDNITYPQTSKCATVSQTIGITEISVKYHRPGARNRKIFGSLIPYGQVWRAGANESTTITFQDSVVISGHRIGPGIYGLHMIPNVKEWTLIFSNNHTQWGSFYYKPEEDALRIKAKPTKAQHQEYLRYNLELVSENKLDLIMHWSDTKVSVSIEVDEIATTLAVIRDEMRTLPRFRWSGTREAAFFCWLHNTNIEEAMPWIDRSIRQEERFENVFLKSLMLNTLDKKEDADEYLKKALQMGEEFSIIRFAAEAIGHHNSPKKAIELCEIALKHFPESANAWYYKGMALVWLKKIDEANKSFDRALSLAKDESLKKRILARKEGVKD